MNTSHALLSKQHLSIAFATSLIAPATLFAQTPVVVTGKLSTTSQSSGVVFEGTALGTANPDVGGIGNRMFWYPGKAAFRVGGVTGTYTAGTAPWDNANIGQYSFAAGLNSTAAGLHGVAIGYGAYASDSRFDNRANISIGTGATTSVLYGGNVAIGDGARVFGSSPSDSFAIGRNADVTSSRSVALGYFARASNYAAVAIGNSATASNSYSAALGYFAIASGQRSAALGYYTTARGFASTVVGQFNAVDAPSATTWVSTDPLFIVGNGTGVAADPAAVKDSNALTILKNGNATFKGVVRVAPGGDIPMFVP